ncbi:MAG: hypothetical protein ACR2P1_14535, partial [Pseudomonadales bacterium]
MRWFLGFFIALSIVSCAQQEKVLDSGIGAQELAAVRTKLEKALSRQVATFELQVIDVAKLARDLTAGHGTLPLVTPENQIVEWEFPAQAVQLRVEGLTHGTFKSEDGGKRVLLPPEQNFRFGGCEIRSAQSQVCGALTIMDAKQTMVSGMAVQSRTGLSFFEPVNLVLGVDVYPNLHIVYSTEGAEPVFFSDDEEPEHEADVAVSVASASPDVVMKETSIVLDGDASYYQIDPTTVWARQEEVFNVTSFWLKYESLSIESPETALWSLDLTIKGQEVWVSGGPDTTSSSDLKAIIMDPNYLLLTPVTYQELHYLHWGRTDIDGLGRAAGVGGQYRGRYYFGGHKSRNHAYGRSN